MSLLHNLLSPISIAFFTIIIGYFVGEIKLFKVSLNLSGVLIVAVIVGWIISLINPSLAVVNTSEYEVNMRFYSNFGTALFVSSIGLSTGNIIDFRKSKDMKAIVVGFLMVVSAFATMRIIALIDDSITVSKLLGCLCGALTTTPGLSSACELQNVITEEVVLGYGCTYLFGVIATVLFVQITTKKLRVTSEDNNKTNIDCQNSCALSGLIQIGCAVILGRLIGNIQIANFSLGNSGGMLCSGIVIGLIVKKILPMKSLTTKMLTPFRNTGLVLFFVGNGIPAGMQFSAGIDFKIILYGILMTIIPIFIGVVFCSLFFNQDIAASTIAGGMTSTPAIGVLVEKHSNISLSRYALAYFGALLTIVFLIRLS